MPVIINDFEVVVEPPAPGERGAAGEREPAPAPPPALRPEDIEAIVRHYRERYLRLLAD